MDAELIRTPLTDEWWVARLLPKLEQQARECEPLMKRYLGDQPLPKMHENVEPLVKDFVRKARTNWERLIVSGPLSRMRIVAIKTSVDEDFDGDAQAFGTWTSANMKLVVRETHKSMFAMRRGFVIVGRDAGGGLLVTAEDPRSLVAETDPANPYKTIASLKLRHNDVAGRDEVFLYMDGRVRVAVRPRKAVRGGVRPASYSTSGLNWDDELSGPIAGLDGNPVTEFENEDGLAEFEPHLPVLDRITDQIVHRMSIVIAQAFKQRAIKGVPVKDEAGKDVDYNDLLRADPMSVWLLPATAEMWESGEVNLQPVLLSIRDDIKDMAATSGTPLYSITPDAANGSAEGASTMREGLTFKTEAHIERVDPAWERVASQMLAMTGQESAADRTKLDIRWAKVERFSLSEKANAVAQTQGTLSIKRQLTDILEYSPLDAEAIIDELTDDMVLRQQMAAARGSGAVAG